MILERSFQLAKLHQDMMKFSGKITDHRSTKFGKITGRKNLGFCGLQVLEDELFSLNIMRETITEEPKVPVSDRDYLAEAKAAVAALGVDLTQHKFTIEDLARGIKAEYEHGSANPLTDVTHDDALSTAKIALAHLMEKKESYSEVEQYDYYDGVEIIEEAPPGFWRKSRGGLRILLAVVVVVVIFLLWQRTLPAIVVAGLLGLATWQLFAMQYNLKSESGRAVPD